jgi:nicotinamidase-related amidase
LLLVNPQNDFCATTEEGAVLSVPGADQDMVRVARLIETYSNALAAIHVVLSCRQPFHIGHTTWWVDADGNPPAPFTKITIADVLSGRWRPADEEEQRASEYFVETLSEFTGRAHIVWPEHCLIGTWGHMIHPSVASALHEWSRRERRRLNYIFKGISPRAEHYADTFVDVPDLLMPDSGLTARVISRLEHADEIWVAGESMARDVKSTVYRIVSNRQPTNRLLGDPGRLASKLVLLTDCMSSMPGDETRAEEIFQNPDIRFWRSSDPPLHTPMQHIRIPGDS